MVNTSIFKFLNINVRYVGRKKPGIWELAIKLVFVGWEFIENIKYILV